MRGSIIISVTVFVASAVVVESVFALTGGLLKGDEPPSVPMIAFHETTGDSARQYGGAPISLSMLQSGKPAPPTSLSMQAMDMLDPTAEPSAGAETVTPAPSPMPLPVPPASAQAPESAAISLTLPPVPASPTPFEPSTGQPQPPLGPRLKLAAVLVPTQASAQRVTAVGDSVMLAAATELDQTIGSLVVDAVVGRQPWAIIDSLCAYRDARQLGRVVIVHSGTNGLVTRAYFDELMQVLEDTPLVVVVNNNVPREWERPNNAVLAEGVKRYSNVVLVDWYAVGSAHPELFWDDGMHLRPEGAKVYAALIAAAINAKP